MSSDRKATALKTASYLPSKGTPRRGLDEAVSYCSKGWFPVNGNYLRQLKERAQGGIYSRNGALFLSDLKGDFALFTHCVRNLPKLLNENDRIGNPAKLLQALDSERIRELLNITEGEVSVHSLHDMPKAQAFRFKHSAISTSTAELLTEAAGGDPNLSFTCATLRQLGLTLIAWNYPTIYTRALQNNATGGDDLVTSLTNLMGFTPDLLTERLCEEWNLHPSLIAALGNGPDLVQGFGTPPALAQELAMINKFCKVGESLAKVADPESFPGATREWNTVVTEIDKYLGSKGIDLINDRVEKSSVNYIAVSPKVFAADLSPQKNVELANFHFSNHLYNQNPFIPKCPDDVKEAFRGAYRLISHGQISVQAVNLLATEVIPYIGFDKGCLYLLNSKQLVLVPSLRIGNITLSSFRPVSGASAVNLGNPIVDALYSGTPIREHDVLFHGDTVSHISWSIGSGEKSGVLHLQLGPKLLHAASHDVVLFFKAARQALSDCLNLKKD